MVKLTIPSTADATRTVKVKAKYQDVFATVEITLYKKNNIRRDCRKNLKLNIVKKLTIFFTINNFPKLTHIYKLTNKLLEESSI